MATLAEIRKQYPEYNDMSDADLAEALYQTHYADMPRHEFDQAVGVKPDDVLGFVRGAANVGHNAIDVGFKVNPIMAASDFVTDKLGAPRMQDVLGQSIEGLRRAASSVPGKRPGKLGEFVGATVASAPTWVIPGGPLAQGAAAGYMTSEGKTLADKARDTGLGAAGGYLAGKVIGGLANKFAPEISPEVNALAQEGVSLTPGMVRGGKAMIAEDKAMSKPVLGDKIAQARQKTKETWNLATVNNALKPLGIKLPAEIESGHDAITAAHDVISKAYDAVVPRLAVVGDGDFANALQKSAAEAKLIKPGGSENYSKRFVQTMKEFGITPNMSMQGENLRALHEALGKAAYTAKTAADPYERQFGDALGAVRQSLEDLMVRQGGPLGDALRSVNKAYRGIAVVDDAAARADDGVFNTGDLKRAVVKNDKSVRKNQSAQGKAYMQDWSNASRKVIPAKTPDSGTAGRLMADSIMKQLGGTVQGLGFQADKALVQQFLKAPQEVQSLLRSKLLQLQNAGGPLSGLLAPMMIKEQGN